MLVRSRFFGTRVMYVLRNRRARTAGTDLETRARSDVRTEIQVSKQIKGKTEARWTAERSGHKTKDRCFLFLLIDGRSKLGVADVDYAWAPQRYGSSPKGAAVRQRRARR